MDTNIKIGIVSLGLIGGSIFKALKSQNVDLVCVSSNEQTINTIKGQGFSASEKLDSLKDCNVVFVCSPMCNVLEMLDKIENIVSENTIVTDVCSLKEFVCKKERPYIFITSHPMSGKETSGFYVSCEDLFKDAKWVLTPFEKTPKEAINTLKEIILLTGAKIVETTAQEHDKAVALISHMPLVLSQVLVEAVKDNNLAKTLASSGFRDMTRLSLSNTVMAQDMVEMNGKNIKESLSYVFDESKELLNSYTKEKIEKVKNIRNEIYSQDGKNIF